MESKLSFMCDKEFESEVIETAWQNRISKSELMRAAVRAYLDALKKAELSIQKAA